MDRLILAALIFAFCFVAGEVIRAGMSLKAGEAEALLADLASMNAGIELERRSVQQLVSALSQNGKLRPLWERAAECIGNGMKPSAAIAESVKASMLSDAAKNELCEFFSAFGSADKDAETRRIASLISRLSEGERRMKAQLEQRLKATRALSLLAGLALSLTVI